MKTVDKALALLAHFSVKAPELGLTEMARLSGSDKATTLRLLISLRKHGIVEQNAETKKYRLGSSLLRLARIREASFPLVTVVQPILDRLTAETGETAHMALAAGRSMISIGNAQPARTTRVYVDPTQELPYHATGSGLAFLAFSPPEVVSEILAAGLPSFTDNTPLTPASVLRSLETARAKGYAVAMQTYEAEVASVAAPIFDGSARPIGSISVACIYARWTPELEIDVSRKVVIAVRDVTRGIGGELSRDFLAAAGRLLPEA